MRRIPRAPVEEMQERRGKRTWISSKECLWRYLSLPCCCAGTFCGWKCSIGFDLSQYSVETGGGLKCVGETDVENEFWEAAIQVIFLV